MKYANILNFMSLLYKADKQILQYFLTDFTHKCFFQNTDFHKSPLLSDDNTNGIYKKHGSFVDEIFMNFPLFLAYLCGK